MLVDYSDGLSVLLTHFTNLLLIYWKILLILVLSQKKIKTFFDKSNSLRIINPFDQLTSS